MPQKNIEMEKHPWFGVDIYNYKNKIHIFIDVSLFTNVCMLQKYKLKIPEFGIQDFIVL